MAPRAAAPGPGDRTEAQPGTCAIPMGSLCSLAVEIWRLEARSRGSQTPEPVLLAIERLGAGLGRLGVQVRDLVGEPFDEGLSVRVVEHEPGDEPRRISECLSPAVYYQGRLLKAADVVTKGDAR